MSWLGAADVAVHQHLHIKHMFKFYLKKKDSRTLFAQLQDAWGWMLREETGILAGKIQGISREQRGGRHPVHGAGTARMDTWRDQGGRYSLAFNLPTSFPPKPASWIWFSGRESGNELMNCNYAPRKREMKPVPWASRANDFPPQVGSHGKVLKVLLTFNLSRWKRLPTRQVKDDAQFWFKAWHLAFSKTKQKHVLDRDEMGWSNTTEEKHSARQPFWDAGSACLHTTLINTIIPLKAIS